ncbi:MAG TPA: glycosyltransferase [Gammaproteobacteria bacterium]
MPRTTVQVVQHLRPGGIETLVLELQRHAARDHAVHVVSLEGRAETALQAWPRLRPVADRLHFLDKPAGLQPRCVLVLAALLRRLGATAVHTHHVGPLLYGGLAARLAGVRSLVHTEHDAWHLADPRRRRLQSAVLRLVRPQLVADAQLVRARAERALPGRSFEVIANGIDTQRFRPGNRAAARRQLGLPEAVRLVGCAARLEAVKDHATLLEALAALPAGVHLALAGDGSLADELQRRADALGLAERVHFLGNLEEMPTFYRALDLFCLASRQEGLPLSPLEAQACGIPCVLTDVGGCREALCPTSGRLVPPGDPAALADALARLLARPSTRTPRAFVLEHGDLTQMTRAYERLYAA